MENKIKEYIIQLDNDIDAIENCTHSIYGGRKYDQAIISTLKDVKEELEEIAKEG